MAPGGDVTEKINDVLREGQQRRSQQGYTRASKLPNSVEKISIDPRLTLASRKRSSDKDRWRAKLQISSSRISKRFRPKRTDNQPQVMSESVLGVR
jgi:hypothetical protein